MAIKGIFWRLLGLVRWPFIRHDWGTCPCCGDRHQDWMEGPLFECRHSGECGGTIDSGPVFWADGYQTCLRCRYRFWVSGSN